MTKNRRKSSAQRGYGYRWQRARALYLRSHPLCVECKRQGRVGQAQVVDHRRPHRGDDALFWDQTNWQSLCKHHHDADKQRKERSGTVIGCDQSGMPTDPNHPWRTGRGG
ncbi:MAG: HNH endonuclease [bacterium]|nr:HNH endonuclease [bacterium]